MNETTSGIVYAILCLMKTQQFVKEDKMVLRFNTIITVFVMLILVLSLPQQAQCEWWLTSGEEDILLIRSDADPEVPKHDIDSGTYGYFVSTEDEYYWLDVVYINSPPVVLEPFDPANLSWVPGPLDVEDNDGDDGPDMDNDGDDDNDEWRVRWNRFLRRHGDDLPEGWEDWSSAEWRNWYHESRDLYRNGRCDGQRLRNLWRHFPQWWNRHGGGRR